MAGVVAFVLEFHAVLIAQELGDTLDVAKRVAEDVLVRLQQILLLPVVLPGLVACRHRVERKIHRAHVERAHFRREGGGGGDTVLDRHEYAAAGRDVDHAVAALLDARQELAKNFRIRGGAAVLGVARMQVQHGGARPGGIDGLRGDLVGRDRQGSRHGRGMNRAGDRAGDDHLVTLLRHGRFPPRFKAYVHRGRRGVQGGTPASRSGRRSSPKFPSGPGA